jgi:hypothetical protein
MRSSTGKLSATSIIFTRGRSCPITSHVLWEPRIELDSIMRWLKGRTSRVANRILGRTGLPFWQDESFDHWVRSTEELRDLIDYVEGNPVKAGLAETAAEWLWSSAWQTTETDRLPHP